MTPDEQISRLKDVIGFLIKDDDKGENDKASAALHDVIAAKARERINPPAPETEPEPEIEPDAAGAE